MAKWRKFKKLGTNFIIYGLRTDDGRTMPGDLRTMCGEIRTLYGDLRTIYGESTKNDLAG